MKKISHPVLANLKLTAGDKVTLAEVYPPELPDLFHGGQVTVFGRYTGSGAVAIKLTGSVGKETREFVYEMTFADKTADDKGFVEDLWARRKVGYLLDQIRLNGEKKELMDEVVTLAKRYGITTPLPPYPSIHIGSRETKPIELIAAYTSFANNGTRVDPIGIQRIEDRQGNILYQSTVKREQVLDPEHNWLMLDMMRDVMRCQPGTGPHRCGTAAGAVGGRLSTIQYRPT